MFRDTGYVGQTNRPPRGYYQATRPSRGYYQATRPPRGCYQATRTPLFCCQKSAYRQCTGTSGEESRRSKSVRNGCCGPAHLYDSKTLFTDGVHIIDSFHAPYLDNRTTDIPSLAVATLPSSNNARILAYGSPCAIYNEGNCQEQFAIDSDILSVNVYSAAHGRPSQTPPNTALVSPGSRVCRTTQCHGQRSDSAIELVRKRKFDRSSKCLLPLFICVAIVNPLVLPILLLYYVRSLHHWRRGQVTRALWCIHRATLVALVGMLLTTCAVAIGVPIYLIPRHAGSDTHMGTRSPYITDTKNNISKKSELHERIVSSGVPETKGSPTAVSYDAIYLPPTVHIEKTTTVAAHIGAVFDFIKERRVYTHKIIPKNDNSIKLCIPHTGECKEINLPSD